MTAFAPNANGEFAFQPGERDKSLAASTIRGKIYARSEGRKIPA